MDTKKCYVCGFPAAKCQVNNDPISSFYVCPVCGRYQLTESELSNPSLERNKLCPFLYYNGFHQPDIISLTESRYFTTLSKEKCDEYVLEREKGNDSHGHPVHLDNDIINSWYPKSFAEKINMILLRLDKLSDYIGQEIIIPKELFYSLMFVDRYKKDGTEVLLEEDMNRQAYFYINYLIDSEYIKGGTSISDNKVKPITISPKGYQRIDQVQMNKGYGRNALVAMKFGNDTLKLREFIKKGIIEADFNPILIDEVQYNEFITPELLSNIRNSRFVVVDLTHQNNGAYFEEGYAMGLGKPVIQLCKKDTKLHFDIAQKNTIIWEKEEDIPLRLKNRIKATIE